MEHMEESRAELNSQTGIQAIDPAQMCQQLLRLSFWRKSAVQLVQAGYCSLVKVKETMQHSDIIPPTENMQKSKVQTKIMEKVQDIEQKRT